MLFYAKLQTFSNGLFLFRKFATMILLKKKVLLFCYSEMYDM
jgi:hypothetical protein